MKKHSRKSETYSVKSFPLQIKDLDEGSRKVVGYLASFNTVDSDRDIILPGAFSQSLKMRGPNTTTNRKIAYLRQHEMGWQIGKFLELEEDAIGLRFVGQLGRSTAGEDALRDYQDGILREHSIGFNYIWPLVEYDEEKDVFMIPEVKLWEGSAVTLGANELTPALDVSKGADPINVASKLNEEMTAVITALKNGKGSDDRLYNLEIRLRILQQKYDNALKTIQPASEKAIEIAKKKEQLVKPKSNKDFLISYLNGKV